MRELLSFKVLVADEVDPPRVELVLVGERDWLLQQAKELRQDLRDLIATLKV